MRFSLRSLAVVACVLAVSTLAAADHITGGLTGLTSPTGAITFDFQTNFYNGYVVSNEYMSLGATFSGFGWDNDDLGQGTTIFAGGDLANGFTGFPGAIPGPVVPMTINFVNPVTAAAFAAVDNGGQYMLEAFMGTTSVDSFTATIGAAPGGYIGFQNESSAFNLIKITPTSSSAISIDNLQFITAADPLTPAVPEPASLLLFSSGMAVAAVLRKRLANRLPR